MIAAAPLSESLRHRYLLEMGVEVYLPLAAFSVAPGESAVQKTSPPVAEPIAVPEPSRHHSAIPKAAAMPRFDAMYEAGMPPPRTRAVSAKPTAAAGNESLRCFGSVGASVVLLLQLPVVPRAHPLSFEYRRSLGAVLEALELNQDRVFVICFNEDVDIDLLRTSMPPAGRLSLGFALADRFVEIFGEGLLRLDDQSPPPRAQSPWKRRIWPALRTARRRLGLSALS